MAEIKFQTGICNYCINCGCQFVDAQPDSQAVNNIIQCGDGVDSGCGTKFIVKKVD